MKRCAGLRRSSWSGFESFQVYALGSVLAAKLLQLAPTDDVARLTAAKRLRCHFGAPEGFGWQMLRRTCGTYLTNAPSIFDAASAYQSAKQLGHSVQVAEKHYVDVARGIPGSAHARSGDAD